jgi:hypothetical protein
MSKLTLPARSARTMLLPVLGFIALPCRSGITGRLRLAVAGIALLGTLLPAAPALAQVPTDDGGWFDPPAAGPADPAPAPYHEAPSAPEAAASAAEVQDSDPSALTTFRPTLDPYGAWVADPKYGTVWVPNRAAVGDDFAPYVSRGHWALTADDDWIWVSDYPFGWAVFHYGRWVWISGSGWAWVPGRTYANAWVVWRVPSADYAYVGWAPMPPSWVWMNGYAVTLWYGPPVPYVFCSSVYVFDHHVHHHIVHDRHLVHRIASHTHVYPTPYRAPAQPTRHTAASPGVRAAPPPSAAPRGPRMTAARIPAEAIPARRTAPPPAAARLAPRRVFSTADAPARRPPESDLRSRVPEREVRTRAPERVRSSEASRPTSREPERRSVAPVPRARSTAPERVRVEPRSPAPSRVRPPSTSRDFGPVRRTRRP